MPRALTCYACHKPATSREHAPPRGLFPKRKDTLDGQDLRRNLIAVPSCDEHNSEKRLDDEFLMWILAVTIQGNATKQAHFDSKAMRAFRRRPDTFVSLLENLAPLKLQAQTGQVFNSASFEVDLGRFDRCMWQIAIALYHHETGEKWLGGFRVFTDAFVELRGPNAQKTNQTMREIVATMETAFKDEAVKGANPEVFSYALIRSNERHAVMMRFYEGILVVVLLSDT